MSALPVINPADVLPQPQAIDTSTQEQLRAAWVAKFAELYPTYDVAMLESDPGAINAEALAFLVLNARYQINDVYRALRLPLAKKADLDGLAADRGIMRRIYVAATATAPAVSEQDDSLLLRSWLAMQEWSLGSSCLGVEGRAWRLAMPDVTDIRVYDYPGEGRMRCVLLPVLGLDVAGRAALVARVGGGLMTRGRRPGSLWIDTVLAEELTLDLTVTLGVLPGASKDAAKAAARTGVAAYMGKTRRIGARVAVSRIEGAACVTNVPYAHLAGLAADLVPTQDQACQLGTLTVLAEADNG